MLYLGEHHIRKVGLQWGEVVDVIGTSVELVNASDFVQPLKPYLRFNDRTNRIIAMPAYVGGGIQTAGLKWIASFPRNIDVGLPRAHSITILNDAGTGEPVCVINTNLISGIRTAGVSGLMLREFIKWKKTTRRVLNVGIVGFGPIGQLHLNMILSMFGDLIDNVFLYDIRGIDRELVDGTDSVIVCKSWEEAYLQADIFVTCTVSTAGYINRPPKKGSLQLNISLRDYLPECKRYMDHIIVDDWNEVCRENTDIENMYKCGELKESDTFSLASAVLTDDVVRRIKSDSTVMFNPMGMAVFDIAVGKYYFQKAKKKKVGVDLD